MHYSGRYHYTCPQEVHVGGKSPCCSDYSDALRKVTFPKISFEVVLQTAKCVIFR